MIALDTNILFYAMDRSAGERHKIARRVLAELDPRESAIPLQCLGELCFSVGRKRPDLLPQTHRIVEELTATFDVLTAISQDLNDAIEAQQRHGLSFWDAMLWAVTRRTGCEILLTEDFQEGRELHGVTFRNPFKMRPADLKALLS